MEADFRFEGRRNLETATELDALRVGFSSVVKAGKISELVELIDRYPQRAANGQLVWLLTSGLAVELTTGYQREHHDLDLVVMDPNHLWQWELLGTDNVTPGQYWADMKFNYQALAASACAVKFRFEQKPYQVEIVHPAIIMTQKLSDAFKREPRQKDIQDAASIAQWWEGPQGGNATWIKHVLTAHAALPNQLQRDVTEARITKVATKLFPIS